MWNMPGVNINRKIQSNLKYLPGTTVLMFWRVFFFVCLFLPSPFVFLTALRFCKRVSCRNRQWSVVRSRFLSLFPRGTVAVMHKNDGRRFFTDAFMWRTVFVLFCFAPTVSCGSDSASFPSVCVCVTAGFVIYRRIFQEREVRRWILQTVFMWWLVFIAAQSFHRKFCRRLCAVWTVCCAVFEMMACEGNGMSGRL